MKVILVIFILSIQFIETKQSDPKFVKFRQVLNNRKAFMLASPYAAQTKVPPNPVNSNPAFVMPVLPSYSVSSTNYLYPAVNSKTVPHLTGISPLSISSSIAAPIDYNEFATQALEPTSFPSYVRDGKKLSNVPLETYQRLQVKADQNTLTPADPFGNPFVDSLVARTNSFLGSVGNNSKSFLNGIGGGITKAMNLKSSVTNMHDQFEANKFTVERDSLNTIDKINTDYATKSQDISNQAIKSGISSATSWNLPQNYYPSSIGQKYAMI